MEGYTYAGPSMGKVNHTHSYSICHKKSMMLPTTESVLCFCRFYHSSLVINLHQPSNEHFGMATLKKGTPWPSTSPHLTKILSSIFLSQSVICLH